MTRARRTAASLAAPTAVLAATFVAAFVLPAAQADEAMPASAGAGGSEQPLWEIGVAAAAGTVPDYPASDDYTPRGIPFPYFAFRGRLFHSDQNGARLETAVRPNVELDVSGGAAFSTANNSSGPRAGMPNLDYLLELGPNLKITLDRPTQNSRWLLELPLRAVASFDGFRAGYQGLLFNPDIGFHTRSVLGSGWSGYTDVGLDFASARYQQYFYQVAPQYALPNRPEYLAHGGYFGSTLELGVGHKLGKHVRLFFYGRIDDYAGGRNENSPLFKTTLNYSAFVGFSWSIWHSKETVTVVEEAP
jgi:outer membrane scaffolding protein for murein synthesis (MipA/OmpV family)